MLIKRKEDKHQITQASLTVRACVIRDGTQGISLSMGENVIGEWTDNRVAKLMLTDDLKVAMCGADGNRMYLFSVPGKTLSGEALSATEVVIKFEMD